MRGCSPGDQASENRGETRVWREHYYPISKDPYTTPAKSKAGDKCERCPGCWGEGF